MSLLSVREFELACVDNFIKAFWWLDKLNGFKNWKENDTKNLKALFYVRAKTAKIWKGEGVMA